MASSSESGGGNREDLSDWKSIKLEFAPESGKVSFIFHIVYSFQKLYKPANGSYD